MTSLANTLNVSDNLIVSEIDNKTIEQGFFGNKTTFPISLGEHAIIVHYKDVFEDLNFAEDRVVKSKDFVVKFTLSEQGQFTLNTTNITNLAEAERFSKNPKLTLTDQQNNSVALTLENVADYKIAQQVNKAVSSYVNKQAIQEYKSLQKEETIEKTTVSTGGQQETSSNTLIQINALPMLKYWWQNASTDEKKHFKDFLKTTE